MQYFYVINLASRWPNAFHLDLMYCIISSDNSEKTIITKASCMKFILIQPYCGHRNMVTKFSHLDSIFICLCFPASGSTTVNAIVSVICVQKLGATLVLVAEALSELFKSIKKLRTTRTYDISRFAEADPGFLPKASMHT